jgi:N-acetylmuramoyl-L-alanine amidase
MKIAIDPGHGMSNAKPNVYDPGATRKVGNETFAEADIALRYGLTLRKVLQDRGIETFMTRTSSADPAPVKTRATRAQKAGCTHFVSLHLNSDDSPSAHGVEVQYRNNVKDKPLADRIQSRLIKLTGFNDHGNDQRLDLAVLKFSDGPAVLIELGFITNTADRDYLIQSANRDSICAAIADVVTT